MTEPQGKTSAFGHGACAVGDRAIAFGVDGVGVRCACGLEVNGRAAPGQAPREAVAFFLGHATRCVLAQPLAATIDPADYGL